MGWEIEGSCPCGYESGPLQTGSGLSDARRTFRVPARCRSCNEMVAVDIKSEAKACPSCGSYDLKALGSLRPKGGSAEPVKGPPPIVERGRWVLQDRDYRCPSCGDERLRFVLTGTWD